MTAAELAGRIPGARCREDGQWEGRCPAHEDERASLSWRDGDRGLVLTCHAGCGLDAIADGLQITLADLLRNPAGRARSQPVRRVAEAYPYRDEGGTLLFEVVRFEPKGFAQRRPVGAGSWTWNVNGVRRVLYRLPEIQRQRVVYVTEGEKDVDRLAALGLTTTCNPGGAGKWTADYTAALVAAGVKEVVVLRDNDLAGEKHAEVVINSCRAAGLEVRAPRLPGLPPMREKHGEDVSDWLALGHHPDELMALVEATPGLDALESARDGLEFTPLGALLAELEEATAWVVQGRLPSAGLSLLAGKPKAGKTTLARCLALSVARGQPWLGFATTPGCVLYLALEEKRSEVRRHFAVMGATADDPVFVLCASVPEDALARLHAEAGRRKPVLIIVDPLFRFVRVLDGNDYATMTAALGPLIALARETGAHVLAVHHLGKGEKSGGDAILGSTAIFAAVDTALLLKRSERYRTLSSIQRYGPDLEEITLALDPVTRTVNPGPSRAEADEDEMASTIARYLQSQPEPV